MDKTDEQLVAALASSTISNNILLKMTQLLKEQTALSLPILLSQSFQSLLMIEHWAWKILGTDFQQWINEQSYIELLFTLASFNMKLVFTQNDIEADIKASLLLPNTVESINDVFEQINRYDDDKTDDTYLKIVSLWFDVLSHFIHEQSQYVSFPIIIHINQHIGRYYIMSDQYKFYLVQLRESNLPDSLFTAKLLFYLKTCSLSVNTSLYSKSITFPFTADELLGRFANDYCEIIRVHSYTVATWSKELLTCITHLISLMNSICLWDDDKAKRIRIFVPPDDTSYEHVQALIRIIGYKPFHEHTEAQWSNDETILVDAILTFVTNAIETLNIGCFVRSKTSLADILPTVAETALYDQLSIVAHGLLGEILLEDDLKKLKITDNISVFFFNILEQAWLHPMRLCKQMPLICLLRGFLNLSKHDVIQNKTADSNKIPLLIEMCDQYPVVYDIFWSLSFNRRIQEQLRSNPIFMTKLTQLEKNSSDDNMRKIVSGIFWNLESKQDQPALSSIKSNGTTFDIMISYSHKETTICKQLYEELIRCGYRVWIDFDQIHGNVIDAMAQAIDQSRMIIICMSEQYRRSNYCRAEAQYAFKRQLKIIPVLLQQHYKPDGWLLFLIGQLLYIDFTKYDFTRAFQMLMLELKTPVLIDDIPVVRVQPKQEALMMFPTSSPVLLSTVTSKHLPKNMQDWTQTHVHEWLTVNNLVQLAELLFDYDGLSLIYFIKLLTNVGPQQMLSSLEKDSLRRTNQSVSLVELARFQSLIKQHELLESTIIQPLKKIKSNKDTWNFPHCCRTM